MELNARADRIHDLPNRAGHLPVDHRHRLRPSSVRSAERAALINPQPLRREVLRGNRKAESRRCALRRRRAVITGSPFARQDLSDVWRLGWAYEAYYDGEAEKLTLKSKPDALNVQVALAIGDYYKAFEMTFSTKEGDRSAEGKDVQGVTFLKDDEVPKSNPRSGSTTGGKTGGG